MAIYEKEFFRKKLAGDNHVAWRLLIDSGKGKLTVESARTSQTASGRDRIWTPDEFRAKGDSTAVRSFEAELRRLLKGFAVREETSNANRT